TVRERAIPAWRPEALVVAHVAAGTGQALAMQRGVERVIGSETAPVSHERRLLGERRMTAETPERRGGIALEHLDELSRDARSRRRGVPARSPVAVLRRVARAARFGPERCFERREARGRGPLWRQWRAPVSSHEFLDGFGSTRGRRDEGQGETRRDLAHGAR